MVLLATARPKVLLIELHNDPGALGSILESVDLEVLPAASVEAAQHLVDEVELDLVLLDLPPHASDGLVVCERLREVTDGWLPIICIAGARDSEALQAAFSAGAVDYLHKPIEQSELLARVGRHIESARVLRELARQQRDLSAQNRRLREELERRREGEEALVAPPLTLNLNAVKEQLIGHALRQTQGNITAAARILGVHRSWFYRRKAP
ncbi:MAG: hypothetical protein RLZZ450_3409 [Pseudomonadota bacterium]|jgi:DNA-binding NtrC family response regulator